jgi:ergothioneine biosynthesis protein EgtB
MKNQLVHLAELYQKTRQKTMLLVEPLEVEDFVIQTSIDVSPIKWHLAHCSWFFEEFVLKELKKNTPVYLKNNYNYIFNSYYYSKGDFWKKGVRGNLSRPLLKDIMSHRNMLDEYMHELFQSHELNQNILKLIEIGIHHEMQHQELILMDIKKNFSLSPLEIKYFEDTNLSKIDINNEKYKFHHYEPGLVDVGNNQLNEFFYDNETPSHKSFIQPFSISNRLVTNREYLEFVQDNGYKNFEFWHSDAWDWLKADQIEHPLYWKLQDGLFTQFTLYGKLDLDLDQPVSHISYYEASAFAEWSSARLPTEQEWEYVCSITSNESKENFMEQEIYEATIYEKGQQITGLRGNLWEWTKSDYSSYPGYKKPKGSLKEYNSKFMCQQYVLRGGSCVTPKNHYRDTYRNFYYPFQNWMYSGIRLAKDC